MGTCRKPQALRLSPSTHRSSTRARRAGPIRRPAILAIAIALAAALPAPPATAGDAAPPARQQLFLSPFGEPFRAPEGAPYPVADWFRKADADGDGRLTLAEFIADGERYFHLLDSSRNNQLEATEIDAWEAAILAPITPRPGLRNGAPPPEVGKPAEARPIQMPPSAAAPRRKRADPERPRGAGLYGIINIRHPIKAADQDMNARVTAEEWRKILVSRFALLDKGNLGYLTLETLPPTPWQEIQPGYKPKKK